VAFPFGLPSRSQVKRIPARRLVWSIAAFLAFPLIFRLALCDGGYFKDGRITHTVGMNQTQLVVLMASLGQDGTALAPEDALSFLAEYLERMRLTMDQSDYEGMLYTGASIWKLQQAAQT
jgi:hypothetical protein